MKIIRVAQIEEKPKTFGGKTRLHRFPSALLVRSCGALFAKTRLARPLEAKAAGEPARASPKKV